MPKSGGSTMNALLTVLSKWNDFDYIRLDPSVSRFFESKKTARIISTIQKKVNTFE